MKKPRPPIWMLILLFALAACSLPGLSQDSATPLPYIPPASNKTDTPPATALPGFAPGEWVIVQDGGFAFPIPINLAQPGQTYTLTQQGTQASLANMDESLLVSLVREEGFAPPVLTTCLAQLQKRMAKDIPDLTLAEAQSLALSGKPATAHPIQGTFFDQPMQGMLVVGSPADGYCLTIVAVTLGEQAEILWQTEGSPMLQVILDKLLFDEVQKPARCGITEDPSYGTTEENPIRVGNSNLYDGIAREEAYLDSLVGPQGQALTFIRLKSILTESGETLDIYQVTYEGLTEPLILYLDMYHYEDPLAPLGLSCIGSIPLEQP